MSKIKNWYSPKMEDGSYILPSQSEPISEEDFETLVKIPDWIDYLITVRDEYITSHNLNVEIENPNANWTFGNSFMNAYHSLATKEYNKINMLRVFSQMYSGNFLGVKNAAGMQVPKYVPEDLDEIVKGYLDLKPHWWQEKHNNLVKKFKELSFLHPPIAFGESGIVSDGMIVNQDIYVYKERLALLLSSGIIENLAKMHFPIILEIGSGYGALAYFIRKLLPNCTYICLDLPESLIFSSIYLHRFYKNSIFLAPNQTFSILRNKNLFVPNYMFHSLVESGIHIDLAINTLSMSEMTKEQIINYCTGLKLILGEQGVFFEQNQDNTHLGLQNARDIIINFFASECRLNLTEGLTQGKASCWSNYKN